MNNKPSVWTDERIDLAERMWKDGKTATAIAARLPGISRNAVLGVMNRHRERFPLRGAKAGQPKAPRVPKPKAEKSAKTAKPSGGSTLNFRATKPSAMLSSLGVRVQAPKPSSAQPFPHRGAALHGGAPGGILFVDLTSRQCAWPLTDFGDADGPDMPCCGLPRRGGDQPNSAYCAGHAAASRGEGR
ncbi:GcrA family cell cycle regulator [Rhizobium sp. CBN3]|uniref:GcrA family cell cycle regulator n=1 Tax=Rhizobium sp. CBN3 TaxID=3058045 RepID=UPI0026737AC0|nr:GcrA family cell cycle regulator [Rhizobium sp. CBN3]MDO3434357.1 GcrA family cell cycle regulator [Rhizobium sp. CBN3]